MKAITGPNWFQMALVRPSWPHLVQVCPVWPYFSLFGPVGPDFALFDPICSCLDPFIMMVSLRIVMMIINKPVSSNSVVS